MAFEEKSIIDRIREQNAAGTCPFYPDKHHNQEHLTDTPGEVRLYPTAKGIAQEPYLEPFKDEGVLGCSGHAGDYIEKGLWSQEPGQ